MAGDKQGYVSGLVILIRKGFLAWLQYRNADTTEGVLQPIAATYRESGRPADELPLLLATLIGGNAYESEF